MATPARTLGVNIGLSNEQRKGVAEVLNRALSDEYLLYTKTRNFHWNVVGPQFNELHKFFQSQYEALNEVVDQVAERIRQIGESAPGTMAEFVQFAGLVEKPGEHPDARTMVAHLMRDHEAVIRQLRTGIETVGRQYNDLGTADFLTGLMEKHEKMAWMLRALLGGASIGPA